MNIRESRVQQIQYTSSMTAMKLANMAQEGLPVVVKNAAALT